MPEVIDWQAVADPHGAVLGAVAAVRLGQVVILPTESGYVFAANALSPEAVDTLRLLLPNTVEPWPLAVRDAAEAREWVPAIGALGQRLTRRLWPGPVTFALAEAAISRVPEPVQQRVYPADVLHLRSPAHVVVQEVLRHVSEPLLLVDVAPASGSAIQLAETFGAQVALILDDGPARFPEGPTLLHVTRAGWRVERAGAIRREQIDLQAACLIVFVCTGNTCRSPLAEALCKKRLSERLGCTPEELPQRGFLVVSAGISAFSGGPAAAEAVEVARVYGAELSGHRSGGLTAELLYQADYLVGMTRGHVEALAETSVELAAVEPRLLSPQGEDLPDPVGCDHVVYEECAAAIWRDLEALLREILPESSQQPANP